MARNLILTAAHCVVNLTSGEPNVPAYVLVGGTTVAQVGNGNFPENFTVKSSIVHPKFKYKEANFFDIAVLVLNTLSGQPSVRLSDTLPKDRTKGTVVGWGVNETFVQSKNISYKLGYTSTTVDSKVAKAGLCSHFGVICIASTEIRPGVYSSLCQGDSGGPTFLAGTDIQFGVNSFTENEDVNCGKNKYAGVAAVSDFKKDFLDPIIANYGANEGPTVSTPPPAPPPQCLEYKVNIVNGVKYVDVPPLRKAFRSTLSACSRACVNNNACNGLNFISNQCTLFRRADGPEKVDKKAKLGYIYCARSSSG